MEEKNHIENPTEPEVKPTNKSKKKLIIIISTVGVVLIALSAVAFFMLNNDKGDKKQAEPKQEESKVNADGLVISEQPLECVPRGHDNYRTNNTLAVDPNNSKIIYVGIEYKGVYKTTDGGETWKLSDKGIRGYQMQSDKNKKCVQELGRTLIDPKDSQHILVSRVESPGDLSTLFSENAGIWESKNGGASWTQMVKDGMNASGSRAIAFDPNDSKIVYYGSNNMRPSFTDNNGQKQDKYFNKDGILYQTTNGGQAWKELPTGAPKGLRAFNVGVDNTNTKNLWLFTMTASEQGGGAPESEQKGTMISRDGGASWTSLASKLPSGYRTLLDGDSSPNGTHAYIVSMTTSSAPKAFVTRDSGNSWQESNVYAEAADYNPYDKTGLSMLGYAPYDGAPSIVESKDGGVSWKKISAVPKEVDGKDKFGVRIEGFAWSKTEPNTVYMNGSGGYVWKSTDGGKTWTTVLTLDKIGGPNKNGAGSTQSSEQDQ